MSDVGRNDPCLCGSGKKFKKYCLGKDAPSSGAYTSAERQSALLALGRFGWHHEFDGDRAVAEAKFRIDTLTALPEGQGPALAQQSEAFFQDWFTCDHQLADGRTLVDLFLQRERGCLRSGELRYLERMRQTCLRPYEIVGVRLDEGLDLRDLWPGQRLRVQERLATRQVVQWDVLAARVMLGPEGVPVMDGAPYLYPARARDQILRDLRRTYRKFRQAAPHVDLVSFFKRFGRLYYLFWLSAWRA